MGYPAYIQNLIDSGVTITSSTEDAVYGHECLWDKNPAKPFRFTATSGGWIEFDFGTAVSIDAIGLANHNFDPSVTLVLKGGSAPNPNTVTHNLTYREHDLYGHFASGTYRYWRLTITETNTENTEIGELELGVAVYLPAFNDGDAEETKEEKIRQKTDGGKRLTYDLYSVIILTLTFGPFAPDVRDTFRTLHQLVGGDGDPFFLILDTDDDVAYYGTKEEALRFTCLQEWNVYTYTLVFTTESRGETITL